MLESWFKPLCAHRNWGPQAGTVGAALAALGYCLVAVGGAHPALGLFIVCALVLGTAYGLCLREGLLDLESLAPPASRGALTGIFYVGTYLGFGLPVLLVVIEPTMGPSLPLVILAAVAAVVAVVRFRRLAVDPRLPRHIRVSKPHRSEHPFGRSWRYLQSQLPGGVSVGGPEGNCVGTQHMGKSEAGKAESAKSSGDDLTGRRILITGAARNIGSSLARRLYDRGASVGLLGLEPELLEQVATSCGRAPWQLCDVADLEQVSRGVDYIAEKLGGIDVVVANAGVEANSSILGGDPADMRRAVEVNLMGTYYTLRAAGPHISHENGYALVVASAHGAPSIRFADRSVLRAPASKPWVTRCAWK